MRPTPGEVIGTKYRIVRLIGDGGMGTVYEARHEVLGTAVALKFLHGELARRPGLAQRFLQEARVSANIQSPHVTRVTDVDSTPDGTPYLVMELLNGESLQQLIDRRGKLPADQAIDFALQTLSGLEAAHAIGVVHRDLKPDNVFVTPSSGGPLLKLIDFGIAKIRASNEYQRGLTRAGALMGTPEYMAPEQLYSAAEVDHRADIFSLGVMLFELLTGVRPADGDDAQAIVGKVLSGDIQRLDALEPELPQGLVGLVHKAMAADRNERFESAHEMRLALAAFAGELSHAGRLAATPHPAIVGSVLLPSMVDQPLATRDTDDDAPPRSNIPRTLPPEDEPAKGATEQAPPLDAVVRRGTEQAAPIAVLPSAAGAPSWVGPPPPRTRPRSLGALIAVLLGALVTGGIVAGVVWYRRAQVDDGPSFDTPPVTTVTALGDPTAAPVLTTPTGTPTTTITPGIPPQSPPPVVTAPPRPPSTSTPAPADAGATPGPTFPPFVLPSSLPSSLPPLPSGFPTAIPTEFPTSLPPFFPAPSNAPDGG